mgnify:CR=1 FL=1
MLNTDRFMHNLWKQLHADFRRCTGSSGHPMEKFLDRNDIPGFRQYAGPSLWVHKDLAYLYKWEYQLQNLFKRYRFRKDLYTAAELNEMANSKFLLHQLELAKPKSTLYTSARVRPVLAGVRRRMREWLGHYDLEEHYSLCCFGTKATNGCPKKVAYYDVKCTRLSGSQQHHAWMDGVRRGDTLLDRACKGPYGFVTQLSQVNVPKSFKALRGITPHTTIGAFSSKGLGLMFEQVCEDVGLPITRTQNRHRRYVKRYSKTRTHATADLSNASNSFTVALLNACLPREWFRACMYGRVGHLEIGGKTYKLESVMTMGVGYTFPLQTLLFYAILDSIAELANVRGLISVYGDDLIYPRELHPMVSQIFRDLGFQLNADKTFVTSHFRESCGADFFNGVDVRPYQPEGECKNLRGPNALSFIYKVVNGLRARWSSVEIQGTLTFLLRTVLQFSPGIHQVPPSFPDQSGVKVSKPIKHPLWMPVKASANWGMQFLHVEGTRKWRAIQCQDIYLWNALRLKSKDSDIDANHHAPNTLYRTPVWTYSQYDYRYKDRHWCQNLGDEELMQIVWRKRRPTVHKGVKRRKLQAVEVERVEAENYCLGKTDIPMWI